MRNVAETSSMVTRVPWRVLEGSTKLTCSKKKHIYVYSRCDYYNLIFTSYLKKNIFINKFLIYELSTTRLYNVHKEKPVCTVVCTDLCTYKGPNETVEN